MDGDASRALAEVQGAKLEALSTDVTRVGEEVAALRVDLAGFRSEMATEMRLQRQALESMVTLLTGAAEERSDGARLKESATGAVVLAARRTRMLKGGGGSLVALADALDRLDSLDETTDPGGPATMPPEPA